MPVINARQWNEFISTGPKPIQAKAGPLQWRIALDGKWEGAEWHVFSDDEVVRVEKRVHQDTSKYVAGWIRTYSGCIEISDELYNRLLAIQDANEYYGPYRVDGQGQ